MIDVVGQGGSVRLLIISVVEALHFMMEYLAAADSILIGAEVWNFIDAGISLASVCLTVQALRNDGSDICQGN